MPTTRLRDALRLAVFLGLVTGFLELAALAVRKWILVRWLLMSPQIVWKTPLAYVGIFAVLTLLWFGLARLLPRLRDARVLVFGLATLGVAGAGFVFHPQLHKAATALFALGVAARLAAAARRDGSGLARAAARATPAFAAVVVALALFVNIRERVLQRRYLAGLPAAAAGAPNVLLLIMDTARALSLSTWGYRRPTSPGLDTLAARGVKFERAFAPAPWTLPSHASMFTGRPAHELNADWWVPLDGRDRTLAEVFRDRGYRPFGVVANTMMATTETGLARGFQAYRYAHISSATILNAANVVRFLADSRPLRRLIRDYRMIGRREADRMNAEFFRELDATGARPFFAFVNYFDPHGPYTPPEPFASRFRHPGRGRSWLGRLWNDGRPLDKSLFHLEDTVRIHGEYDGSVAYTADAVSRLLAELDRRGVLANTIVVVASDHGEEFYEHGHWEHSATLYQTALRIPLIVAGPGVPAGIRVRAPVGASDIAATVLDLAGVPEHLPGRSLARFWRDTSLAWDTVLSSRTPPPRSAAPGDATHGWSLVGGDLHYIRTTRHTEELYNYVRDPLEQRDLAADTAYAEAMAAFRQRLRTIGDSAR